MRAFNAVTGDRASAVRDLTEWDFAQRLHVSRFKIIVFRACAERHRRGVNHGAFDEGMAELIFYHDEARPTVQQIGRQRVPEQMREHPPPDLGAFGDRADELPHVTGRKLILVHDRRKKKVVRLSFINRQIVDQGFGAFGRNVDAPVFPVFPTDNGDVIVTQIKVFKTEGAQLNIAYAGISQQTDDRLFSRALGGLNQARNLAFRQCILNNLFRFAGTTELDFDALEFSVMLNCNARVDDVAVAVILFVHPQHVFFHVGILGTKFSHPAQRDTHGAAIAADRCFS